MLNWLVPCVSAWSEQANGGSGEKEMSHARRLMLYDECCMVNSKDLKGCLQRQEGLTASLAFPEYTSLYHPRVAQVCLSVRILTVSVMISQAGFNQRQAAPARHNT